MGECTFQPNRLDGVDTHLARRREARARREAGARDPLIDGSGSTGQRTVPRPFALNRHERGGIAALQRPIACDAGSRATTPGSSTLDARERRRSGAELAPWTRRSWGRRSRAAARAAARAGARAARGATRLALESAESAADACDPDEPSWLRQASRRLSRQLLDESAEVEAARHVAAEAAAPPEGERLAAIRDLASLAPDDALRDAPAAGAGVGALRSPPASRLPSRA